MSSNRRYNHHIYYGCTRSRDINCKGGYIAENHLLKQLEMIIDQISLDKIGMKDKIEHEVKRFESFQHGVLGIEAKPNANATELNIRNYAKYILKSGTTGEKRELLTCLKSKVVLKDRKLELVG